jgi:hypothetical protein
VSNPFTSGAYLERPTNSHANFEAMTACMIPTPPPLGSPGGPVEFLVSGQAHWWRDNGDPQQPWHEAEWIQPKEFLGAWSGTTLILSRHYTNLEAVSVPWGGGQARHTALVGIWGWVGPTLFGANFNGPPAFLQSSFGQHGNFEVAVPSAGGGLAHWWRNNDDGAGEAWSPANVPVSRSGSWQGAGMLQPIDSIGRFLPHLRTLPESVADIPFGNLELVGVREGQLVHMRQAHPGGGWSEIAVIDSGVQGRPGFVQSGWGRRGNFEVVVGAVGGGLRHYFMDRDDPDNEVWRQAPSFGTPEPVWDVSLFYSSFDALEVLVSGTSTYLTYSRIQWSWRGPIQISLRPCRAIPLDLPPGWSPPDP